MEDEGIANAVIVFLNCHRTTIVGIWANLWIETFQAGFFVDIWQLLFERNTINMSDRTDGTNRKNMIAIST